MMQNQSAKLISIVIPAYNEEQRIEQAILRVKNISLPWKKEIIIVNDGSTDKTKEILEKYKNQIQIINLSKNQGVGKALCVGFSHAKGDILVRQDADLEYPPEEIYLLINPIIEKRAEAVYGFRGQGKYRPNSIKKYHWGGVMINTFCKLLYGFSVKDFITGAKAFHKNVFTQLNLISNGFEIESEMTAKIIRMGYTLSCVPFSYEARTFQEGKKIRWHHSIPIIRDLIYWRFAKIPSRF